MSVCAENEEENYEKKHQARNENCEHVQSVAHSSEMDVELHEVEKPSVYGKDVQKCVELFL